MNEIRKPEYHLYLYSVPITYLLDFVEDMQLTVDQVNYAISIGRDVMTIQVCTISTLLFTKGYRIFVHDKPDSKFEITLGKCERTNREIRMGHNLERMILTGEFELDTSLMAS